MSVATNTVTVLSLKPASARVRADWLLLPWMAAAVRPSLTSFSAKRLAPCLVRVKTSTWCQPLSRMMWLIRSRLWCCSTRCTVCVTSSVAVLRGVTDTSPGLFSTPRARVRISSENVAENSRFWRCLGRSARILRMSRMKPMSSMRSASSSTRISTPERSTVFWPQWSSRRPGVATRMSSGLRSAEIWGLILTPPNITMDVSGVYLP
ncbi:hypothetical protein LMG1860_04880 [Achromobacter denitrificans]|nr:hypothetical protein LMG1860_04880 [Achromobacter denitrificans]